MTSPVACTHETYRQTNQARSTTARPRVCLGWWRANARRGPAGRAVSPTPNFAVGSPRGSPPRWAIGSIPTPPLAAIEAGSDGHVVTGWPDWRVDIDGGDGMELVTRVPDVGAVAVEFALADVVGRLFRSACAKCRWCSRWQEILSG